MRRYHWKCFIFGHDPLCEVVREPGAKYLVETTCTRCTFKRRTSYEKLFEEAFKEMEKDFRDSKLGSTAERQ